MAYINDSSDKSLKRVRVRHFKQAKAEGTKITALTSYDTLTAEIFDEAGIDFLLVGDSVGNVVYGYDSTIPVTMDEMIPVAQAVARTAKRALVVADLPFGSYESGPDQALANSVRFMKETGVHAVKLEGGVQSAPQIKRIVESGIPVLAHIGFTPQSEHGLGGHVIQARDEAGEEQLIQDALAVQEAGAFGVVLELVPSEIAQRVTDMLEIPTIGIGAGVGCDGQILVWTDFAGLTGGRLPKFVKQYAKLRENLQHATAEYIHEVREGLYPGKEHSYE